MQCLFKKYTYRNYHLSKNKDNALCFVNELKCYLDTDMLCKIRCRFPYFRPPMRSFKFFVNISRNCYWCWFTSQQSGCMAAIRQCGTSGEMTFEACTDSNMVLFEVDNLYSVILSQWTWSLFKTLPVQLFLYLTIVLPGCSIWRSSIISFICFEALSHGISRYWWSPFHWRRCLWHYVNLTKEKWTIFNCAGQ